MNWFLSILVVVTVIDGQSVNTTKAQIATAFASTCFSRFGKAVCWGGNYYGQLGRGDASNDIDDASNVSPIDLGDGFIVKRIAGGDSHFCAVSEEGRAKCWGYFLCFISK